MLTEENLGLAPPGMQNLFKTVQATVNPNSTAPGTNKGEEMRALAIAKQAEATAAAAAAQSAQQTANTQAAASTQATQSATKMAMILGGVIAVGAGVYFGFLQNKHKPSMAGFGAEGSGINNRDREDMINNDEGLYKWFEREKRFSRNKGGMRGFIKRNKEAIDDIIRRIRG